MLIPVVDRRVELLSIVMRLVGNPEYNGLLYRNYTDKIEEHFTKYKKHGAVKYAGSLLRSGLGFDAPMRIALCLDEEYNFTDQIEPQIRDMEMYRRLNREECEKLASLLSSFVSDTHFNEFFDSCKSVYESSVKAFIPVSDSFDAAWHREFFGESEPREMKVVIAPGNGGSNYGTSPPIFENGIHTSYAIIGIYQTTKSEYWELPVFNKDEALDLLVHEITHSYANRICDMIYEITESSINVIFDHVKKQMQAISYGVPQIMLYEYLTRAVTIVYTKNHDESGEAAKNLCIADKNDGFIYINELIAELENYAANRDVYPTMDSFVPVLAETFENLAATGARHASQGQT